MRADETATDSRQSVDTARQCYSRAKSSVGIGNNGSRMGGKRLWTNGLRTASA
jgi:hypothetical protein